MGVENKLVITVNGTKVELDHRATISDLLAALNVVSPAIAVELNQQIVSHAEFDRRNLKQDDVVEIVTLVGGG